MITPTYYETNHFGTRDILLVALLLVPGITHMLHTGNWEIYFRNDSLDGQFLYILSKLVGLYAIILLWLQLMSGLVRNVFFFDWHPVMHRNLGLLILSLVVLHVVLFVAGVSIRNGYFAYKLLLPNFFGSYYPKIVALGIVALWLLIMAAVFAAVRNKLPVVWKWAHRLMLAVFALGFVHSYLIGSEARAGGMLYLYYLMGALSIIALVVRLMTNRRGSLLNSA